MVCVGLGWGRKEELTMLETLTGSLTISGKRNGVKFKGS